MAERAVTTVRSFDDAGTLQWERSLVADGGSISVYAMAFAPDGDLVLVGMARALYPGDAWSTDLGDGETGGVDVRTWLGRFDRAGRTRWVRMPREATFSGYVDALVIDDAGHAVLSGYSDDRRDLLGQPLNADAAGGSFIEKLDGCGAHVWSQSLPRPLLPRISSADGARVVTLTSEAELEVSVITVGP